jgi:hypothetical protein
MMSAVIIGYLGMIIIPVHGDVVMVYHRQVQLGALWYSGVSGYVYYH